MARFIGRTSLRRSPRSHQAKKYLNKGAPVLYIGSTDISNPASAEELNSCIVKLVEEKYNKTIDTKIFINSQDYLRVVSSNAGRIIFCVPVDVIVNCINAHQKYIAFSASTSLNPNSNTIHMAHVFECASERQVEDLYDALLRTIEYVHNQADFRDDTSKVAPQFTKLSVDKPAVPASSFVMYHSTFQPENATTQNATTHGKDKKLVMTNHAVFRNAFEYMKQGNQEKLHALICSDLSVLSADDAGQTLLHLSVKLDKFSVGKFLVNQCCSSDAERESLRRAKVSFVSISFQQNRELNGSYYDCLLLTSTTTTYCAGQGGNDPPPPRCNLRTEKFCEVPRYGLHHGQHQGHQGAHTATLLRRLKQFIMCKLTRRGRYYPSPNTCVSFCLTVKVNLFRDQVK